MRLPVASMLEGFVSQLLADYLSNYVKGIQREQFRLGIWNGVAQLENVELRLEAFDYLQLPFAIKQGIVGKLKLQVPWKKLGWEPIVISLEDVFICVCPRDEFEWNAEALEARSLAAKKAKLAAAELAKLSARISRRVSDDNSGQSFLSHLSAKIIDNVQVTAQNVHFRYIDQKTDPEVSFSFGITFTGLTMNTTDALDSALSGSSTVGKTKANQVIKLVEVKKIAVYWNSDEHHLGSLAEDFDEGLSNGLLTEKNWIYLVQPFDVSLRFMVNKNFLFDGSTPQYTVVLDVNDLAFTLEDRQLHEMLSLWDALSICKLREKYGRFRPSVGQHGYNRRESGWQMVWWQYAVQAVLVDVRRKLRRSSWSHLEWRMDRRRQYVALYKLKLECLQKDKPAADEKLSKLEELEKELDVDEILSFRSIAENHLQLQDVLQSAPANDSLSDHLDASIKESVYDVKSDDQSSQKQRSWLNFLSLGMLGAAGSTDSGQFAGVLPDEIIQDIYEATKYHPIGLRGNGDLPKGYCCVAASMCVAGISIDLRSLHPKKELACLFIRGIDTSLKMWQQSTNVFITIKALEAADLCESDSTFPIILGVKGSILPSFSEKGRAKPSYAEVVAGTINQRKHSLQYKSHLDALAESVNNFGDKRNPVVVVEIEFLSEDRDFDMTVKVSTQPLEFVYSSELMKCMTSFFSRPASLQTLQELIFSSLNRLQSSQVRMHSKAEFILEMRKRVSLQVHMQRPVVILPENLQNSGCTHLVVIMESMQITSLELPSNAFLGERSSKMQWPHFGNVEGSGFDPCAGHGKDMFSSGGNGQVGGGERNYLGETLYPALYDQFRFQLCNVQVILASHSYSWQDSWNDPNGGRMLHLVEQFDAEVVLEICALRDEPTLTRFKVHGNLPGLQLFLSSRKWKALRSLFAHKQEVDEHENIQSKSVRGYSGTTGAHASGALADKKLMCDEEKLEGSEGRTYSTHSSHEVATLEISLKSKTLLVELCLREEENNTSTHESIVLFAKGEDAALMFTQYDSQEELQMTFKNIQIEKLSEQSSGTPCLLLYSESCLSVMATFMFITVWEWKWVASELGIIVRGPLTREEQIAVIYLDSMEFTGLVRKNCLENLKLNALQFGIFSAEAQFNNQCCTSECEDLPISHKCSNWGLHHHRCKELLKCRSVEATQPGLEIVLSFLTRADQQIFISLPFAEVYLHLTAWSKVIQALAAVMETFESSAQVDSDIMRERTWDQARPLNVECLNEEGECSQTSTTDQIFLQVFQIPDNFENKSSAPPCHDQMNERTTFLRSSVLVISVLVPDCSGDRVSAGLHNAETSENFGCSTAVGEKVLVINGGLELDLERNQREKSISITFTFQVDELLCRESMCMFKATLLKCEGNLKQCHIHGTHSLPLLQIMEVGIKGNVFLKKAPKLYVSLHIQVKRVDVWCSYAILCFLNSFDFERWEASDPTLVVEANITTELQRGSIMLSDGRWSCNAPIFELRIRDMETQTTMRDDRVDFDFSSGLEVDYHNMEKVMWEPLIEPWNVSFCMGKTVVFSRVCHTKFRITSSSQLNMNITKALLQATSRAVDMFHDAVDTSRNDNNSNGVYSSSYRESMGNKILSGYAPYWFQNDTGVSITYWLVNSSRCEDDDALSEGRAGGRSSSNVLHPGCSIPLYIEETPEQVFYKGRGNSSSERLADKKAFGGQHRMICVQLEGTYKASSPMSIDLVGSRSFSVVFSHSSGGASKDLRKRKEKEVLEGQEAEEIESQARGNVFCTPVVFEVSVQRYSKLIRIYSTVTLVNATSIPMEVRFDIPFGILPKVMEPILPGQVIPLPVHLAETGQIRWRPMGSSHLWSEAQSLSNILLPASRLVSLRSFVCYPAHPSNAPFRCCVMVGETLVPSTGSTSTVFQDRKDDAHAQRKDMKSNLQAQQPLVGGKSSLAKSSSSACVLREITFQAPFVFKNCLPLPLSLTIESGAGFNLNVDAPEGDSVFVFEINNVHDLTLTISVPGFSPALTKFARATATPEFESVPQQDEKRFSVETLSFLPKSSDGSIVYAKIEKLLDSTCGAREMSIYVPLWFYNCSGVNLGIVDGDDELFSGKAKQFREHLIARDASTGNRDLSLLTKCAGLQTVLQVPNGDSARSYSHSRSRGTSVRSFLGGQNIISCRAGESCPAKDESKAAEAPNLRAHLFSPFKDEEPSEKRLRARIALPQSLKGIVDPDSTESIWSRPFALNAPGGTTTVVIPEALGKGAHILSVVFASALGACAGKTRTITFLPRFVLANACNQDLCYRQQGTDAFKHLLKGEQAHLHWSDTSRVLLVSVRFDEHGWDWSGGFVPDQLGDTQLKVRNYVTGATQMLRIEVQNVSSSNNEANGIGSTDNSLGTYLVLLSDDDTGFMPYRIDNFSMERVRFYQQKCEKFENIVLPYSSCAYAWDEPWRPHRLVLEIPGEGCLGAYDLDEVKEHPTVQLPATAQKPERRFSMSVHAEGPRRVLSFQDMSLHLGKCLGGTHHMNAQGEQLRGPDQGQDHDMQCTEEFTFSFSSIGLSVIDSFPQEVVFACARGVSIQLLQGPHQQRMDIKIAYFQVDNQLRHAQYPVMISAGIASSSTIVATEGMTEKVFETGPCQKGAPFEFADGAAFTLMVVKWRHLASSVDCFQLINVRLAQVQLQLDEQIVCCLLDFSRTVTSDAVAYELAYPLVYPVSAGSGSFVGFESAENSVSKSRKYEFLMDSTSSHLHFVKVLKRAEEYMSWPAARAVECVESQRLKLLLLARGGRKVYIETLYVAPIKVTVSFSSASWLPKVDRGVAAQSLLWITGASVQRGLMALVDVEGAPVRLRQLSLAHPLARWDAIKGMIIRHYTRQLLHEVYKILGSAGVLGNPMGFVRSLGSGVIDFVSAPARSFIQSPRQLGGGIAQGTQSLVSNTVFAVSDAATQISRAARKGVTAFALNHEYAAEMKRRQQECGFQDYGVISELLEGLTGLLQSPVTGAERHGIPGILSGVAVGAVGLVARPVASILEVAGRTAQSIRSWSQPIQRQERRIRPPRYLSKDCPLLPYSWEEAIGNAVLVEAVGARLQNETYITYKPLAQTGKYLLLTETLLLKVTSANLAVAAGDTGSDLGPEWSIDSEIALEDILHIDRDGPILNILMGPPRCLSRKKRHFKRRQVSRSGPLLHESIEMTRDDAAEEVASTVRYFVYECCRGRPQFIIASKK